MNIFFSKLFTKIIFLGCFLYLPIFGVCATKSPSPAPTPIPQTPEPPKTPQATCTPCHGETGNSEVSMWPKIAGQYQAYLLKQLQEYQKGEAGNRYNPNMYSVVEKLTSQELVDLADYYAKQTMSSGVAQSELVLLGEKIYRAGHSETGLPACASCHGPTGAGNSLANIPKLSGQHMDYTISQLKLYQTGERRSDPNQMMRNIANHMTEKQMQAVSSYLEGLYADKT